MVTQGLHRAGLYLGPASHFLQAAPDNPEGFFEHAGFVRLSDDLLEACGGAWDHLPPAPPMGADDPRVAEFTEGARHLIDEVARAGIWGWKDPRAALTIRYWLDLIPDLKVVICVRHPLEVAMSLKRRNNTSYLHALSLWEGYYDSVLAAVDPARRIVTHYDAHANDPTGELTRLIDFAGLSHDSLETAVATHKDSLRHHYANVDLGDAAVRGRVVELYEQLCAEAGYTPPPSERVAGGVHRDSVDIVRTRDELERRGRQVAALQRERDELARRVADLENAGRGELLDEFNQRLNYLEDAVHEPRYWIEGLADRADADVIRGCRELVRELPHRHRPILVVCKGDPLILDLYGRPTWTFPSDGNGQFPGFTFSDSASAIAHLESMRAAGAGYLLVPQTFQWWLTHYAAFTEHLVDHYTVVAERTGEGVVFDLTSRRVSTTGWPLSLTGVLDRITRQAHLFEVSVLDWTTNRYATRLTGRNIFPPSTGDPTLSYIDKSIDVVLLDEIASRDREILAEAERVARYAVLTVTSTERPEVLSVDLLDPTVTATDKPVIKVLTSAVRPDERWQARVIEALADEATVEFASDPAELAAADLIAVIDEGVVPLSGILDSLRATLDESGVGAVAGKLLGTDGSLLGAGAMVFRDGSVAGISAGSFQVSAPWHEYMRDVCGSQGVLWLNPSALNKIDARLVSEPEPDPMVWSASVWAAGLRVRYQPGAAAVVSAERTPDAAQDALVAEAYAPALDRRPDRPDALDDRAWRALLATDDVEGGWR
jgi:hypothetical protein